MRDIKNARIRNLVRGALAAKDDDALRRTMERLRQESSPSDAAIAFRFLQEGPLAHQLLQPSAFPRAFTEIAGLPLFTGATLQVELASESVRLSRHADRIVQAIRRIGHVNGAILAGDYALAVRALEQFKADFGVSLLMARKAISVRHMAGADIQRETNELNLLAQFIPSRQQVVTVAFEDSLDVERDYIQVRRSFLKFVIANRLDLADAPIIVDQFSPLDTSHHDFAIRLQALSRWGVIDTTVFLMGLAAILRATDREPDAFAVEAVVPAIVREAWHEEFARIDVNKLNDLIGGKDQFFERVFFAHAPAWSEFPEILQYRIAIEAAVGARLNGEFPWQPGAGGKFARSYGDIHDLLSQSPPILDLDNIDPRTCGAFHRTVALAISVERSALGSATGDQLSSLLDQTIDVPSMFSRTELSEFMPKRNGDLLYEYLRSAVINDAEDKNVSEHALRRALQRLIQERFQGEIVKLLEHVDTENGHVSGHLYNKCSEAFLTELYDLYSEADQVMEAQASILEWRGSRKNDIDATNRAKSQRLNLRLRKIRGAIDETRIYVDPLRFVQWLQETVSGELKSLSPFIDDIVADKNRSVSLKDTVRVAVVPRLRLLKLLDECYEEFCTNKIYGVSSFIGRRIRHGTLHGHLVLEFEPEVRRAINDFRDLAPKFASYLESWFSRFDIAVKAMAAERMRVNTKDWPHGLIVASLDETDKETIVNAMIDAVVLSLKDRSHLGRSLATIQEFCWLVLEIDMKRARDAMEVLRREFIINVDQPQFSERPDIERPVNDRIRALNASLQTRFEIVRSWLTRPSNLSPSASVQLLFTAVLDEVRQRYPGFSPKLEVIGVEDIDLFGHRFHFFYDALYILVDNAARHGQRNGKLKIRIDANSPDEKHTDLTVSVESDVDDHLDAQTKIDDAMRAEVGDAMVKDIRSGIRKLRALVEDVEEIMGFEHSYDGNSVIFTINMRYVRSV